MQIMKEYEKLKQYGNCVTNRISIIERNTIMRNWKEFPNELQIIKCEGELSYDVGKGILSASFPKSEMKYMRKL